MSRIAALCRNVAVSDSNDDLAPLGTVYYDWEWAMPASPVVHRACGAMFQCIPCVSSVHENGPTLPPVVRDPGLASQVELPAAVQAGRCMETPHYKKVNALAANKASWSSRVNIRGMSNLLSSASLREVNGAMCHSVFDRRSALSTRTHH
eukprot:1755654-Pyramimonas_sp.AAC.1